MKARGVAPKRRADILPRVDMSLIALIARARAVGSTLRDPFTVMSFLGLEVIPSLKLTDLGLVDVNLQQLVPLFPSD